MKKPHIQIHDSRKKKGQFFIRYVAANGKKLAHSETLTSVANVNKNLVSTDSCFMAGAHGGIYRIVTDGIVIDFTKSQHWAKKYGCKSGLKQSKTK